MQDGAASSPPSRGRVIGLAALGYGYLALVVAVIVGLIAVTIVAALHGHPLAFVTFGLVALVVALLRSLSVSIEPPTGIELRRTDAPRLWSLLDGLREALAAPRIDRLQIDDTVNASVRDVPRLGLVGPSRSCVTFGLPLLQALSPEEATAVIAHELGHLSRRHGRFGAWAYRTRARWTQVLDALRERESLAYYVLAPVFSFVVPRFDDATLAISRAHEHDADEASAAIVGADVAADALVAVAAAGAAFDAHWRAVWAEVEKTPSPPLAAALALAPALVRGRSGDAAFAPDVEIPSDPDESHPSLGERLRALGQDPAAVVARMHVPERSAATELLGDLAGTLDRRLADEWAATVGGSWSEHHGEIVRDRARLNALDRRDVASLDPAELIELARLRTAYAPDEPSLWPNVLERLPDEPEANLRRGAELLDAGDDAGLPLVERAVALDDDLLFDAIGIAFSFFHAHGREVECDPWLRRLGVEVA